MQDGHEIAFERRSDKSIREHSSNGGGEIIYGGKLEMMHSRSSNPYISLVFEETNCENIANIVSIWPLFAISEEPRGIIDDNRRTRAGTFPLELQSSGLRMGGIKDW